MPSIKRALQAASFTNAAVEVAEAIDFDGTNDYLSRASDLSGNADGKTFTISAWVYKADNNTDYVYKTTGNGGNDTFQLAWISGSLRVFASNAGVDVLNTSFSANYLPINTWIHFLASVDMANSSNRYVYINDVNVTSDVTWTTYSNATIPFTNTAHYVGSNGSTHWYGRLAHVYLDYTYRNLSTEANRRYFIDADGYPTGEATQSALSPILYLPLTDPDAPGTNAGTGGDFTMNGTIARSGRGPNQDNCVASDLSASGDYLTKSSLTGAAATKTFTLACNVVSDGVQTIFPFSCWTGAAGSYRFYLSVAGSTIKVQGWNSAGTLVLEARVTSQPTGYITNQVVWSIDMNDSGTFQCYINGVSQSVTVNNYTNDTVNFGTGYFEVHESNAYYCIVGEIWFDNSYTDLSSSNPFWDSALNKPVSLRKVISDTGITPLIALPMYGNDAGNNLGSGGDFTVNSGPYTGARGASEFWARSVDFDGTTDYYSRSAALSGAANGKTFACAIAFRADTVTGTQALIGLTDSSSSARIMNIELSGANLRAVAVQSDGATTTLLATGSTTLSTGTWYVALISMDMSDTGKRSMYINGAAESPTYSNYVNTNIEWVEANNPFIGQHNGSNKFDGRIGFIWMDDSYIDFSDEAERLKFFDAFNYPVDIGEDGSNPTGAAPLIYMRFNDSTDFGANSGTGGDFTENGTPIQGADVGA